MDPFSLGQGERAVSYARSPLRTIRPARPSSRFRIAHINAEPAADERGMLLAAEGVRHRYPVATGDALRQVDFHVRRGSLTGLLGPNGAGKSTLLAILNGLSRLQRGRVTVAGCTPDDRGRPESVSSLVPQSCAFYDTLTVRENLAFMAGVHGLARARWQSGAGPDSLP